MRQVAVLVTILLAAGPAAAEVRGLTARDLVRMDRLSDPQVSADGSTVVFVRRTTDLTADRGRTDLWLVGVDGEGLRQLTSDPAGDWSPRWGSGTEIFFLSSRSGSSQVWTIRADGGEARRVTDLPLDVSNFVLSSAADRLAVTMEVFPDCDDLACTEERLAERKASPRTGLAYDSLFVRHWDTIKDGRRSHLFVTTLAGPREGDDISGPREGDEFVDVTRGMDADVPAKPFGGAEEITFTPDARGVVFASRDVGAQEPWSTDFDLYYAPIDGSEPPRCLTEDNEAWDTNPVFSPDGEWLAWLAMERPGFEADRFRIVMKGSADGPRRVITEDWDRSPGGIVFSPDSKTIYTTTADVGEVRLYAVDVETGVASKIAEGGHVRSPSLAGDRIIFGLDHLQSPVDLYSVAMDGSDRRRLTHLNADRLAGIDLGDFEQFSFPGWNDETVWGYVIKPAGFEEGKRYPLAFLIHGGPQGSFDNDFHYRWNPQTYAGAGYAVVMIDFHGSVGYGQDFTDSISGDWGGKPFEDLQKGLAAALERYPWIDGDRACALGASYGGYMINWIAGNWPDRFRCLVNHDGVFDNRSMYFATEELWFPEWEHGGTYWDNPEGHEKHNPARFVENWTTPMLVIHGALDFRVPETQGLAAFTALQRKGIPSRFLYFPDENHWVLKPNNSILWHEEVLGWLERWTE